MNIGRLAASLFVVAGALAATTAPAAAQSFKQSVLSALADDSYLTRVTYDRKVFRELARSRGTGTGVQALAVERIADHAVVVAYAGTNPKDGRDVLADLGIGADEADFLVKDSIGRMASDFERLKWIPKGSAEKVRTAMTGAYGGLKIGTARATSRGKLQLSCPKGSFFDPRKGGECWSCPSGYVRSVLPVTGSKACARLPHTSYARAKKERQNSRIGQGCPKGQFWDIKGGKNVLGACYSCPGGYHRGVAAVDHANACVRVSGAASAKATYRAKALCPRGAFFDLVDGGSCWSCPSGYSRGLAHVKSGDACVSVAWKKKADTLFNAGFRVDQQLRNQLKVARAFLDHVLSLKDSKGQPIALSRLIITGHSLGGFIAQVMAGERKVPALTVNAPGAAHYDPALKGDRIVNLSRRNDAVGRLGRHLGQTVLFDDVRFDFKTDIAKGKLYLGRNHSATEFTKTLRALRR